MAGEIKKCAFCGDVFWARTKNKIYCCENCKLKAHREKHREILEDKACEECGKIYKPRSANQRFCCEQCKTDNYNMRRRKSSEKAEHKTKKCIVCGKEFVQMSNRQLCCSKECSKQYQNKEKYKKPTEKKTNLPTKSIVDIAVEARKEHLTYGQYVAKYGI